MVKALNQQKCPKCGADLPGESLSGLCPACLMDAGAETQTAKMAGGKAFQPPSLEEVAGMFPQLEVLQMIGAGGMGAVYKARQPVLDRFVALKILPPGSHEGVNFAERFNREARALARLSHPNIVAVHEFGHTGGLHYFIMEYVDGANLRQLQKAARLSPREAMQIIPQICDALQYAHDEGVVHRDIKPENVLVDRKGRVKIADFGLAKILGIDAGQARLTVEGQVMGTPHYMAPEQVERPLTVDHRADIYSLGVVFYEMLTGDLPLGKFSPPSRKVSLDVRLDDVVLRALENDPERRYQRAGEVKTELEDISAGALANTERAPVRVENTPPAERYVYWAGIPLVVDRKGEREITWNGGLNAVLIGFLLATAGLGLTRLVTGVAGPSVVGIPFIVTLMILGAGFRWALSAPLPDPEAAAGRKFNLTYVALGSILLAAFAWGVFRNLALPEIRRLFSPGSATVAKREPGAGTLVATLPKGARVELLAVRYPDAAANQWWRYDGTPAAKDYLEVENPGHSLSLTTTNRDLVMLVSNLPRDASGPQFEFSPATGYAAGTGVLRNGQAIQNARPLRLAVPPGMRSVDLRVGFGLDPWRTIAIRDVPRQVTVQPREPRDPYWETMFHSVNDTSGGAQATLVLNIKQREWNWQLVALDTNGVAHSCTAASGTPVGERATWTCTFRNLPLEAVKEFRIQVQPVHWAEFRKVRLEPRGPLPSPEFTTFSSAREVTFSDWIDFDTGQVQEELPALNSDMAEGSNETLAWVHRFGMDASAGNGELLPIGMTFAALENADWERLAPREVAARLHAGMFIPAYLKPWKEGQLPSTFAFRTREGGTGLMQLVRFEPDRPGLTLRYKLVSRPTNSEGK